MKVALLLLCLVISSGCTTGYWADRGRDASDIFTATVGVGGGASARVGPVGVGMQYFRDYYGLRGGCVGGLKGSCESGWFIGPGIEKFDLERAYDRDKAYCSAIWFLTDFRKPKKPIRRDGWPVGPTPAPSTSVSANFNFSGCGNMSGEGAVAVAAVIVAVCSVSLPMDLDHYPKKKYYHHHWPYYTQLETTISLGGGMRLGLNLGECVDFFLGFVGKDIFEDDLERNAMTL